MSLSKKHYDLTEPLGDAGDKLPIPEEKLATARQTLGVPAVEDLATTNNNLTAEASSRAAADNALNLLLDLTANNGVKSRFAAWLSAILARHRDDQLPVMFGSEYLLPWLSKVYAYNQSYDDSGPLLSISFSGDSTTFSNPITADVARILAGRGFRGVNIVNNGHSGATSEVWRTNFLPDELAANYDLMIIRYGINDYLRPPADVITTFRAALTRIRVTELRGPAQMGIILMSPNVVGGSGGNALTATQEKQSALADSLRAIAREFQCAFLDLHALYRAWGELTPDGLHPYQAANFLIADHLADYIFPQSLHAQVTNVCRKQTPGRITLQPWNYHTTIEIQRAYDATAAAANGLFGDHIWPEDGFVRTTRTADGITLQECFSQAGDITRWRIGTTTTWSPWNLNGSDLVRSGNNVLIKDPANGQTLLFLQTLTQSVITSGRLIVGFCQTYADRAAAIADSALASGALYHTTAGGDTVYRKP